MGFERREATADVSAASDSDDAYSCCRTESRVVVIGWGDTETDVTPK